MSFPKCPNSRLFLVTVTILPPTGPSVDLGNIVIKLKGFLEGYASATRSLHRFKVTGEPMLLAVIQASNVIGLERSLNGLSLMVPVKVECIPIMNYENFARSIKVNQELTKPNTTLLDKEGLYWLEFNVGYQGKTTDELIAIWKREAEAVLKARHNEGTSIELYKVVAERKVHVFINASEPEQVDVLALQLPIMQENGNNVTIKCRAIMFLDDFCNRIQRENIK